MIHKKERSFFDGIGRADYRDISVSINQKIERMERQLKTIEYRLGNPNQRSASSYRREDIVSKLDYIGGRLDDIEGYLVK